MPGTMLDWAGGRSSGRSKLWLMSHRGRGDTIKKSYSPFLEITFILLALKYILRWFSMIKDSKVDGLMN